MAYSGRGASFLGVNLTDDDLNPETFKIAYVDTRNKAEGEIIEEAKNETLCVDAGVILI